MVSMTRSVYKRMLESDNGSGDYFVELPTPRRKRARSLNGAVDFISVPSVNIYKVRGFINLGASCYINSIIQALMHTPPLRNYFLSGDHMCYDDYANTCQMCELSKIVMEYNSSHLMPPMSLHRLLYLVWLEAPCLAGTDEQDAHEFYMTYLQLLRKSCVRSSEEFRDIGHSMLNLTSCNIIIDQLYAGILQSNLMCLTCGNVSKKQETFYDISLQLSREMEMEDLYNCLENYIGAETLSESCEILCPHCASHREFVKSLSLLVLPNVLNINLKRFTQEGCKQKKLENHVEFPFELEMMPFIDEAGKEEGLTSESYWYSLSSVINHKGCLDSGHYTAYIKQADGLWFFCNDHQIKMATSEEVLRSQAYILIYQRKT